MHKLKIHSIKGTNNELFEIFFWKYIVSNTVLVMKVSFSLKAIYTTTKHYNWIPNDRFDFFDLEHELGNMG